MLTVADYNSPLGKQVREFLLVELLDTFQKIREDRHILIEDEGDAMRFYIEAKLRELRPVIEVAA